MFDKILVANRGEIAIRIMKTLSAEGIAAVAIYSSADRDSLHVQKASEAYWVGDAPSAKSYLNIPAIIAAALKAKAQAIHPGYGFLSENPQFAKACQDAGLVFIGPSIKALEIMGSKQLAKQKLEKTNTKVPLVPGYHGNSQTDEFLLEKARSIGFPILLKAALGGGGKGMRAVQKESDFLEALQSTRREALAYFGDSHIILEKLVSKPRHIEVQIMADNFGSVVHLFERDCSIQRRHQKIIEEAPAPDIAESLRRQLTTAAMQVARAIDYRGAGTVEFLLDENQQFYFMEMNTRLQVEHPVTEMITGLDLVSWQIQIAAGMRLPLKQEEIQSKGHALECRIYAEDPAKDFLPSLGEIQLYQEPEGPGIRVDSAVSIHSQINQYYDPMIAKLISHGKTREQALLRMQQALNNFQILGLTTNLPFLQNICKHEVFIKAAHNTHFLDDLNLNSASMGKHDKHLALQFAVSYDYLNLFSKEEDPLYIDCFAWQMHLKQDWCWRYLCADLEANCIIRPIDKGQFKIIINNETNETYTIHARLMDRELIIEDGSQRIAAYFETESDGITVYLNAKAIRIVRVQEQGLHQKSDKSQTPALTAPMHATIVSLLKKPGDSVKKNEALMVLEAMKMEHTIRAPEDGMLAEFFYAVGEQVNEGVALLRLDKENA